MNCVCIVYVIFICVLCVLCVVRRGWARMGEDGRGWARMGEAVRGGQSEVVVDSKGVRGLWRWSGRCITVSGCWMEVEQSLLTGMGSCGRRTNHSDRPSVWEKASVLHPIEFRHRESSIQLQLVAPGSSSGRACVYNCGGFPQLGACSLLADVHRPSSLNAKGQHVPSNSDSACFTHR